MLRKFLLLLMGFGIMGLGYAQGFQYVATVKNYYPSSTVSLIQNSVFPGDSSYYCPFPPSAVTDTTPQTFVYGGINCSSSKKVANNLTTLQPYVSYILNITIPKPETLTCTFTYSWDGNTGCNVAITTPGNGSDLAKCTYTANYSSANNSCNYSFIFEPTFGQRGEKNEN